MDAISWTLPADTRPLREDELVEDDHRVLKELVDKLSAILANVERGTTKDGEGPGFAWLELDPGRTPRVVMIDGERGVGKTSLMLTLLDRLAPGDPCHWVRAVHGRVLPTRLLDFDPLPAGMPLLAWILQAFEPLVDHATRLGREVGAACLDELERIASTGTRSLRGTWQQLHDDAVVAWREPVGSAGGASPEQELRRVRTWGHFPAKWRSFCDALLASLERVGCCRQGIVLVPIDDVDLQISRAPELLRFLRLLQHPRVVFLLTGHAEFLEHVIQLDVDGQRRHLAGTTDCRGAEHTAAGDLGRQAVEKTILPAMRVQLKRIDFVRAWAWRNGALTSACTGPA